MNCYQFHRNTINPHHSWMNCQTVARCVIIRANGMDEHNYQKPFKMVSSQQSGCRFISHSNSQITESFCESLQFAADEKDSGFDSLRSILHFQSTPPSDSGTDDLRLLADFIQNNKGPLCQKLIPPQRTIHLNESDDDCNQTVWRGEPTKRPISSGVCYSAWQIHL